MTSPQRLEDNFIFCSQKSHPSASSFSHYLYVCLKKSHAPCVGICPHTHYRDWKSLAGLLPSQGQPRSLPGEALQFGKDAGGRRPGMQINKGLGCTSRDQGCSQERPQGSKNPKTESKMGFLLEEALQEGFKLRWKREQNWSWRSRTEPGEPWKHNKRNQTSLLSPQRSLSINSLPGAETNSMGCQQTSLNQNQTSYKYFLPKLPK